MDRNDPWAPLKLGVFITLGYFVARGMFDGIIIVTWGLPEGSPPLWQDEFWWTELVNGALFGYVPAALVVARHGIEADVGVLRPWLTGGDNAAAVFRDAALRPAGSIGTAIKFIGVMGAIVLVFLEPSVTLGIERSLSNPEFVWSLLRISLFAWWICSLFVADQIATRAYYDVGRNRVEIDLLDVRPLSQFARRGLRSALMWVIFSIIFSLFWLGGDTAARQNIYLLVIVLAMASAAFVVPLLGVHSRIQSVKKSELDRLRDEILAERAVVLNETSNADQQSPRLANLIAYYQLIERAREWPVDAANLLRFFLYLLIGLGSWLGGAVVELLLNRSLGG
jgi:hypothetical protein